METKVFLFEQYLHGNSYDLLPYDLTIQDHLSFILTFNYYYDKLSIENKIYYDYCLKEFDDNAKNFIDRCKKHSPELLEIEYLVEYNFYEGMFQLELIYADIMAKLENEKNIIFNKTQINELVAKYEKQTPDDQIISQTNLSKTIGNKYESSFYKNAAESFINNWFDKYPDAAILKGKYPKACAILDATYLNENIQAKGISKTDYFRYTLLQAKCLVPDLSLTEIAITKIIKSIGKPSIKNL